MAIPEGHRKNFQTLVEAAKNGDLALLECLDAETKEPRYVICAVNRTEGEVQFMPFGHLFVGDNPFDNYLPPAPEGGFVENNS